MKKKDKAKMWTRILSGVLLGVMVLGTMGTLLYALFAR